MTSPIAAGHVGSALQLAISGLAVGAGSAVSHAVLKASTRWIGVAQPCTLRDGPFGNQQQHA